MNQILREHKLDINIIFQFSNIIKNVNSHSFTHKSDIKESLRRKRQAINVNLLSDNLTGKFFLFHFHASPHKHVHNLRVERTEVF